MNQAVVRWHLGPLAFYITRLGFPPTHTLEFDFSRHPDYPGAWMAVLSFQTLWITLSWRVHR